MRCATVITRRAGHERQQARMIITTRLIFSHNFGLESDVFLSIFACSSNNTDLIHLAIIESKLAFTNLLSKGS